MKTDDANNGDGVRDGSQLGAADDEVYQEVEKVLSYSYETKELISQRVFGKAVIPRVNDEVVHPSNQNLTCNQ